MAKIRAGMSAEDAIEKLNPCITQCGGDGPVWY